MTGWPPWAHYVDQLPKDLHAKYVYSDIFTIYYPYSRFLMEAYRGGEVALWNPYILCGAPIAYLMHPVQFLLYSAGSLFSGMTLSAVLHVFAAGFFMFGYLRLTGLGAPASALASAGYMFSSFDLSWAYLPTHIASLTWIPLILLSVEQILRHKRFGYSFALIFGLTMALYEAYPQFVVHICYLTAAYTVLRVVMLGSGRDKGPLVRAAGVILFSVVMAGLLYLVQAVDFYQNLQYTDRLSRPFSFFEVGRYPLSNLLAMFSYNVFGRPQTPEFWAKGYNFGLVEVYIGPVLSLLMLGAVLYRKGALKTFWFITFCLSLLLTMSNTVFKPLFLHMPGFAFSRARPTVVVMFSAIVLAGMGLDWLLGEDAVGPRGRARLFGWLSAVSFAVCLGLALSLWRPGIVLGMFGHAFPGLLDEARLNMALKALLYSMSLLSLGLLALAFYFGGRLGRAPLGIAVFAFLLVDLLSVNKGLIYTEDPRYLYMETDGIKFLKEDRGLFRVLGYGGDVLPPNTGWAFGIQDARGYLSVFPADYKAYMENIEPGVMIAADRQVGPLRNPASLGSPAIDLMNVKYMLTPPGVDITSGKWELVHDGDMRIYRNRRFLTRGYFVSGAGVVSNRKDIFRRINGPDFDPRSAVLLEEASGLPAGFTGGGEAGQVRVVSYKPKEVVVDATAGADGLLVLLDSYYPGWKSYVDGSERKILRAYGNFRAVALSRGRHTVRFAYDPSYMNKYFIVSISSAGGLVLLACLCAGLSLRKRIS